MKRSTTDVNLMRFERVSTTFDRAWNDAPEERRESAYRVAGEPARLRIVGQILAQAVRPAIAHLGCDALAAPRLAIDLWDERVSAVRAPAQAALGAKGNTWRIGEGWFAASPDGRFVSHALGGSLIWLDRETERIVGWFADGDGLSLHQRGKPLQLVLAVWASDRGLQAVHAAMVARDGAGVLIPGGSGSGKSTAALACVAAGYRYLGDDWIGIGEAVGASAPAYGLYNSTFLEPSHARCFPYVQPYLIAPRDQREVKSLILLNEAFPDCLASNATVRALALPRIVAGARPRIHPARRRDALLVLVPSSVFSMYPRPGREGIDRLARLVQQIPAYWLDIGSDLEEIPRRVDDVLAAVGIC